MEDYKISYNFLHTQVLCVNLKAQKMGLDSSDIWLKICIDLDDVIAVKELHSETEGNIEHGKAALHLRGGEYYMVNIDYEKAVEIWTNFKVLNAYPELRKK